MNHRIRRTEAGSTDSAEGVGTLDFSLFFASEIRGVVDLAFALTGDRALAEDLAQDAFAAAYRSWERIRLYDDPGAFVRRVVSNRRVSAFRRSMREASALSRLGPRVPTGSPLVPEPVAEIWAAVRRLPLRQAQVVALHYVNGLSLAEIGAVLGISKDSANTHMRRARATLAEQLMHLREV